MQRRLVCKRVNFEKASDVWKNLKYPTPWSGQYIFHAIYLQVRK